MGLTSSSTPEVKQPPFMAMIPTVDSGLDWVLWDTRRLAASCCAARREGM